MAETKRDREAELAALSAEELERRLREAFFYPDQIDETVFRELEELREALEKKRPTEGIHGGGILGAFSGGPGR